MENKKDAKPAILLLSEHVAGRAHWRADDIWEYLRPGVPVALTPEPENAQDPWAVALSVTIDEVSYKIGYIPRGKNRLISALLLQGWNEALSCVLTRVDPAAPLEHQLFVVVKLLPKVNS